MAKAVFEIGDRVYCQEHDIGTVVRTEFPDGGTGEVVEVDFDRIGVKLVSISYTQLKLASTANEHQSADEALDLRQRSERTFVTEEEENEHYMGTHWDMRCQPWRAKRRLVVPSSREAALLTRRAHSARGEAK